MKSHHQVALSVLTLCISQQLYAQTDVSTTGVAADAATSEALASNSTSSSASTGSPNVTLDTIKVTADARTGTALAQKLARCPQ